MAAQTEWNGRIAKCSLWKLVMRQTMVSSAQSPKFVCVRQKRFLKGLLQNASHFATAPFQPANTSLGFLSGTRGIPAPAYFYNWNAANAALRIFLSAWRPRLKSAGQLSQLQGSEKRLNKAGFPRLIMQPARSPCALSARKNAFRLPAPALP